MTKLCLPYYCTSICMLADFSLVIPGRKLLCQSRSILGTFNRSWSVVMLAPCSAYPNPLMLLVKVSRFIKFGPVRVNLAPELCDRTLCWLATMSVNPQISWMIDFYMACLVTNCLLTNCLAIFSLQLFPYANINATWSLLIIFGRDIPN